MGHVLLYLSIAHAAPTVYADLTGDLPFEVNAESFGDDADEAIAAATEAARIWQVNANLQYRISVDDQAGHGWGLPDGLSTIYLERGDDDGCYIEREDGEPPQYQEEWGSAQVSHDGLWALAGEDFNECDIRICAYNFDRGHDGYLLSVMVHEMGHCLGLDHDETDEESVMSTHAGSHNEEWTSLGEGDVAALAPTLGRAAWTVGTTYRSDWSVGRWQPLTTEVAGVKSGNWPISVAGGDCPDCYAIVYVDPDTNVMVVTGDGGSFAEPVDVGGDSVTGASIAWRPAFAGHPDGLIVVAWRPSKYGRLYAKYSTDRGRTFNVWTEDTKVDQDILYAGTVDVAWSESTQRFWLVGEQAHDGEIAVFSTTGVTNDKLVWQASGTRRYGAGGANISCATHQDTCTIAYRDVRSLEVQLLDIDARQDGRIALGAERPLGGAVNPTLGPVDLAFREGQLTGQLATTQQMEWLPNRVVTADFDGNAGDHVLGAADHFGGLAANEYVGNGGIEYNGAWQEFLYAAHREATQPYEPLQWWDTIDWSLFSF